MQFNSVEYLLFLPIVVGLSYAIPHRWRWALLLVASYGFYMAWKAEYAVLIALSTVVDYWVGLRMGRLPTRRGRRKYLVVSLVSNLALLGTFKYFNFLSGSVTDVLASLDVAFQGPSLDLLLPIGISFYTFQTISYTVDVYRGDREPERHLGIFALYVSFFPQLVAGPIERSTRLLPRLRERHVWQDDVVTSGAQLIAIGLLKKIVIADSVGIYVDEVYETPAVYQGLPVILATYFFAFQIYCDFSGYTDIARGSARLMGFDLMENFRRPYLATSVGEFWSRWHISLSTWFRDYLYIPLGGNRVSDGRWLGNVLMVFVVSGLWHGAAWTFVAWGALHGFYLVAGRVTAGARRWLVSTLALDHWPGLHRTLQTAVTFHLVLLGWVLFRANSMTDAWLILRNMTVVQIPDLARPGIKIASGLGQEHMVIAVLAITTLMGIQLFEERQGPVLDRLQGMGSPVRWMVYAGVTLAILNLGLPQELPFIYFQF